MDAITLPDPSTPRVPVPPSRESPRRLWQAPVFVLGLCVFVGFWFVRSCLNDPQHRCSIRELAWAREQLDLPNGDAAEVARKLQNLIEHGAVPEERAGEAYFLYGTAHIRLAESTSEALAREHWSIAGEQLDEAERRGVPEGDQSKLQYRLGKVGFYLQSDPEQVAKRLAASINDADDRAEGYNLLTKAYLRLTPPNLSAALDANYQLRQQVIAEEILARARITGGELLLRMGRSEEARSVLETVQTPPALVTKACILRAGSYQDDQKWDLAATLWEKVLTAVSDSEVQAGTVRYHLGLCYRRLDQPQEAAKHWEECLKNKSGDESNAAALELAELYLQNNQDDKALQCLELALQTVHKAEDWNNPLLDHDKACELFERCCQTARQASKFDLALKLVALYRQIASPGRALVMQGDLAADWARMRREAATKLPLAAQPAEELAVRQLFKQAANAYEQAANQNTSAKDHGDYLWLAATRSIDAGEQAKAQELLDQIFKLTPRPDTRLGEGWYLLGESFRNEMRPGAADRELKMNAAKQAYLTCINYATPFAYWARYQLARFQIERGNIDTAAEILEQNVRSEPGEETEIKQRSRFTLVHIFYERERSDDYKKVVQCMEKVLEHLPATPEATRARYELADSYRILADEQDRALNETYRGEQARENGKEMRDRYRKRAVEEFDKLVETMEKPQSANHLDDHLEGKRNVYYYAAFLRFQMAEYEKSLAAYELMMQRYNGSPDYWTAVAGRVSAYTGMKDVNKVKEGLEAIRRGLSQMDEETRNAMEQHIRGVDLWLRNKDREGISPSRDR